jgi:hypothetical protein
VSNTQAELERRTLAVRTRAIEFLGKEICTSCCAIAAVNNKETKIIKKMDHVDI